MRGCLGVIGVLATLAGAGESADWPAWRGPDGTGQTPETPMEMPALRLLWKQPTAGRCDAGPAAVGRYVVMPDHRPRQADYYRCLDANTGKELWSFAVRNPHKMDYGAGPRATPLIHAGKVYTLGALGDVHCLDLETGKLLWRKHYRTDFGRTKPPVWGYCTAPVLAGGHVVLMPADLVALDPNTGKTVWTGKSNGPNYAMFAVATLGGRRQIVTYDERTLGGWSVADGTRLWSLDVIHDKGYNVPTPVPVDGKLLVASEDEDTRLYAFGEAGKLKPEPLAENEDLLPEISTPTAVGEALAVGISEGVVCLDLNNNLKTCWILEDEDPYYGAGHVVASKDRALLFGADGTMVLLHVTRKAGKVLGTARLSGKTWSHPALSRGRIFTRDAEHAYGYAMEKK